MNYEKICNQILESNEKIRYAAVYDYGELVDKIRPGITSHLTREETETSLSQAIYRGTAEIILDPSSNGTLGFSGITSQLATGIDLDSVGTFEFDSVKCARDTGYIVDGAKFDTVLGTNYNSVYNGIAYQRATGAYVQGNQQSQTTGAISFAKAQVLALTEVDDHVPAETAVAAAFDEVIDIITNGTVSVTLEAFSMFLDKLEFQTHFPVLKVQ